jgi:dihydrolipoamide dehydrogenase
MTYDVIVLGSGPAGFYFAKSAANYNKKVLLIENDLLGGTGFRTGCLPVKAYLDGLRRARAVEETAKEGWFQGQVDQQALYQTLHQKIERVESFLKDQLVARNIDVLQGEPTLQSETHVRVGDTTYRGDYIVLATGTKTKALAGCTIDEDVILTHKGMVGLKSLPSSLTIIGGNVEGIEFASYLSGFGVAVKIVALGRELLEGTDSDLSADTLDYIVENGGEIYLETSVQSIERLENKALVTFKDGSCLETDKVLITGARSASLPKGLEDLNPKIENTCLLVNDTYETSIKGIYAIGDLNGLHGMAHIAIQQGIQLADYLYGGLVPQRNYQSLPRAIFTINEIAGAGLQENDCRQMGIDYTLKEATFDQTFRGWSKGLTYGKIKILLNGENQVIGAWMTGESASDYIGLIGLWIDRKISLEEIKASLFIHPGVGEGILDATIN